MEKVDNVANKRPFVMAVWARVVLSIAGFILVLLPISFAINSILGIKGLIPPAYKSDALAICSSVGMLAGVLIVTYLFRKYIDRESYLSLGFSTKGLAKSASLALAVLTGVMILGTVVLYLIGSISIAYSKFSGISLAIYLITFMLVAFNEEILFRGYILSNLMRKLNRFWALTISSILFGLMHSINPNVQVIPIINIILAGYLLGAAYIYTRNLWYPIILHFLWNFVQGPVLGYPVSGISTPNIFTIKPLGAAWVNGGGFGFEGSIVYTVLCLIAIGLIVSYYRRLATSASS